MQSNLEAKFKYDNILIQNLEILINKHYIIIITMFDRWVYPNDNLVIIKTQKIFSESIKQFLINLLISSLK